MNGNRTHLLDHRKDPGLVLVVAVRTHAKVDLLLERVLLVRRGQLEDAAFKNKALASCLWTVNVSFPTCPAEQGGPGSKFLFGNVRRLIGRRTMYDAYLRVRCRLRT